MLRTARRAPSEPRKRRAAVLGKIEVIEPLRAPWHVMSRLVMASLDGREPLADRFRAAQVGSTRDRLAGETRGLLDHVGSSQTGVGVCLRDICAVLCSVFWRYGGDRNHAVPEAFGLG